MAACVPAVPVVETAMENSINAYLRDQSGMSLRPFRTIDMMMLS
jgi:hypothetical protein